MRCQCNTRGLLSKLEKIPPHRKIHVTSKSPVGDISDVTLIRTDTTLDHSQKAEKVCKKCPVLCRTLKQKLAVLMCVKRVNIAYVCVRSATDGNLSPTACDRIGQNHKLDFPEIRFRPSFNFPPRK